MRAAWELGHKAPYFSRECALASNKSRARSSLSKLNFKSPLLTAQKGACARVKGDFEPFFFKKLINFYLFTFHFLLFT